MPRGDNTAIVRAPRDAVSSRRGGGMLRSLPLGDDSWFLAIARRPTFRLHGGHGSGGNGRRGAASPVLGPTAAKRRLARTLSRLAQWTFSGRVDLVSGA